MRTKVRFVPAVRGLIARGGFILVAIAAPSTGSLNAEVWVGLVGGRNSGDHVAERLVPINPALHTERGSRLSYRKDFDYAGLELGYRRGAWELLGGFRSTFWHKKTPPSRDEDFTCFRCTERSVKMSLSEGTLYDTAYTVTGSDNFIDSTTKTTISGYDADLSLAYFAAPPSARNGGLFFVGGVHYAFFKFRDSDLIQIAGRSAVALSKGPTLSYANTGLEYSAGLGYRFLGDSWSLDLTLRGLYGSARARDIHILRQLVFLEETKGPGFLYGMRLEYMFFGSTGIGLRFYGHRFFSRGVLSVRGGETLQIIVENEILSGLSAPVYLNTKEGGFELSIRHRL